MAYHILSELETCSSPGNVSSKRVVVGLWEGRWQKLVAMTITSSERMFLINESDRLNCKVENGNESASTGKVRNRAL